MKPKRFTRQIFPIMLREARQAGHGGGDFFTNYHFAEAIRKNERPYFDIYRGLEMAMVGIQAWRSCLDNGAPYEIPDFRQESVRAEYEEDNWSPWPEHQGPGQPPPSISGLNPPSEEAITLMPVRFGTRWVMRGSEPSDQMPP